MILARTPSPSPGEGEAGLRPPGANASRETAAMELKRAGSQPSQKGPASYFTGNVRIDPLNTAPEPARREADAHQISRLASRRLDEIYERA
jgi:hypothetical protein